MKTITTCSKMIALSCAIAFILSSVIALLLLNSQSHFLKAEPYKTILDEQGMYDQLPLLLAEQIALIMSDNPCLENPEQCEADGPEGNGNHSPPPYLKNLKRQDWEQMLSLILTPDWTQSQIESILDQFFTALDQDQENLTLTVSLMGLKENLTGQKGMEFIRILIDAQPPCTQTLLDLLLHAAAGDFSPEQLLLCRPPTEIMERITPTMEAALDLVMDDIPDQATLGRRFFGGDDDNFSAILNREPGLRFQTFQTVMRYSPIIPGLFLMLLTLFAVRSGMDLLFWWGIPFLLVGLSILGSGLLLLPLWNWFVDRFVLERIPTTVNPAIFGLFLDIAELMLRSYVRIIANQAAAIAYSGIALTGAGLWYTSKPGKKPPMPH